MGGRLGGRSSGPVGVTSHTQAAGEHREMSDSDWLTCLFHVVQDQAGGMALPVSKVSFT